MKSNFNPKHFVKTASQTFQDKEAYDAFICENESIALPFHVEGLEKTIPLQYPGELAIYAGRSHHGKSTALRDAAFKAQKRIEGNENFLVGMVSLEDTSETTAAKQIAKYDSFLDYTDDNFLFIGNSFGMTGEQMADLNTGNIIRSLEYGISQFEPKKQYSSIFIDYAQIIPPDPERRMMTSNDQRRLQVDDDVRRLFHAAKQFKAPIGLASQALLKTQRDNYTSKIKIPGAGDLAESGTLYSVPDIVYCYWFPAVDYPSGGRIEEGNWNFKVEDDVVFIRVAKRRNAEIMGFVGKKKIINRVFPCKIRTDGSFYYSAEYHRSIYLPTVEEMLA